jgi:hypothetical protein
LNIYNDFGQIGTVEEETINKYKEYLPKELIEAWKTLYTNDDSKTANHVADEWFEEVKNNKL